MAGLREIRRALACVTLTLGAIGCVVVDGNAKDCRGVRCRDTNADDGDTDTEGPGDPSGDLGLPCDVRDVLRRNCMPCHGNPPIDGAPMAVASVTDFVVPAASDVSVPVYERVAARIDDELRPMPADGSMSEADKAVLRAFVSAGAPASDVRCEDSDDGPVDTPVGPDALPCEPTLVFAAHAAGSDGPFTVPQYGADNLYQCFSFKSPLTEPTQAVAWAPIIDDERVVHHWILFRSQTPQPDGAVGPCQMPADALFVAGWAPGGANFELPADVGLELGGPDDYFILQMHYHNSAEFSDAHDKSGVAFCTPQTPREQTAGVVTLGSFAINIPPGALGHEVTGTCPSWITSTLPEPMHIIASFPHMHELGRSITTEVLRGGQENASETLVRVDPWSFDNQKFYPHEPEVLVHPGDAVRTTCTYDNPGSETVHFGERTEDEMCFNFAVAYPIEALGESRVCGVL